MKKIIFSFFLLLHCPLFAIQLCDIEEKYRTDLFIIYRHIPAQQVVFSLCLNFDVTGNSLSPKSEALIYLTHKCPTTNKTYYEQCTEDKNKKENEWYEDDMVDDNELNNQLNKYLYAIQTYKKNYTTFLNAQKNKDSNLVKRQQKTLHRLETDFSTRPNPLLVIAITLYKKALENENAQ